MGISNIIHTSKDDHMMPVPEPGTFVLMAVAFVLLFLYFELTKKGGSPGGR